MRRRIGGTPEDLSSRDKQIVCGLFLSKYDKSGLAYLGFESFSEAFNAIGYGLGAKPASIKNYRDELDPFFPNTRQGWHRRPLREHCKRIMERYKALSLSDLGDVIRSFLSPDQELERLPEVRDVLRRQTEEGQSSFAKRLITGKAAEAYFLANYRNMPEFTGALLKDTTQWGCGFDFKMTAKEGEYSAVEVKGLRARLGQIQFTDLEHAMADALSDRYYLVLVLNFAEQPFHSVFRNPLASTLTFERKERKEVRLSWVADVSEQKRA
jgi:hypothetical protein